ncbi:hypothetical protein BC059799_2644 [Bacillus cereus NVH0597-99]|nr:hypothetical protein BC059799_2644 [Bacillus cereus NVH0597-99]
MSSKKLLRSLEKCQVVGFYDKKLVEDIVSTIKYDEKK